MCVGEWEGGDGGPRELSIVDVDGMLVLNGGDSKAEERIWYKHCILREGGRMIPTDGRENGMHRRLCSRRVISFFLSLWQATADDTAVRVLGGRTAAQHFFEVGSRIRARGLTDATNKSPSFNTVEHDIGHK
ncbi:hypothetical protein EJ04DRAFT_512998 [Polyplosphaeria fusca]|uniref:Uncharacterized protein n=1 Tax=Polyplosphaeria fusca TaxID=682080 RepID=A0A9P4V2W6_9PLEO|nr:hypothetical protein EJ04DRAFT_512998 [Polyplosphaeria fusca]